MQENKFGFSTKIIAETAVFVSLATVLSYIKIGLSQGGSVTAGSMVPILWLALRRGPKVGLFAATLYGIVQLAAEPFIVHPAQLLLDYPIAFGVLGVAGFFQKRPFVGVTLGIIGRFISHFISGIVFWADYTPEGMTPILYSAAYNGGYMLVELVISIYMIYLLQTSKVLNKYL